MHVAAVPHAGLLHGMLESVEGRVDLQSLRGVLSAIVGIVVAIGLHADVDVFGVVVDADVPAAGRAEGRQEQVQLAPGAVDAHAPPVLPAVEAELETAGDGWSPSRRSCRESEAGRWLRSIISSLTIIIAMLDV